MGKYAWLAAGLTAVSLWAVVLAAFVTPQDLIDEVWPQRQEAPACPPPAEPVAGERAYG